MICVYVCMNWGGLGVSDGNPIGLYFVLSTNSVSSGSITFTLRHEPTKPNMGIEDAGGETDIEATFDVSIQ